MQISQHLPLSTLPILLHLQAHFITLLIQMILYHWVSISSSAFTPSVKCKLKHIGNISLSMEDANQADAGNIHDYSGQVDF
jgi:hypothetical protein